mmetsp:Transcript_28836/g.60695  ORF Transcript_28836/g.60695 Transcript_28836/m.60695 type:complete len:278 (-) Transcript_28836:1448-2281(-)
MVRSILVHHHHLLLLLLLQIASSVATNTAAIALAAADIPGTVSIRTWIVPSSAASILILLGRVSLDVLHGLNKKLGSIGYDVIDNISSFSSIVIISVVGIDIVPVIAPSNYLGLVEKVLAVEIDVVVNRRSPVTAPHHLIGSGGTRRVGRWSRRLAVNGEGVDVAGVEAAYAGDFGDGSASAAPAAFDDVGVAGACVHYGMRLLLLLLLLALGLAILLVLLMMIALMSLLPLLLGMMLILLKILRTLRELLLALLELIILPLKVVAIVGRMLALLLL